jgi:hypothetical protein
MTSCTLPRASCSTTLFSSGVFLAHDLFELYGLHASILQLCKRASSLDRSRTILFLDRDGQTSGRPPYAPTWLAFKRGITQARFHRHGARRPL